jgi:hypothetical protein
VNAGFRFVDGGRSFLCNMCPAKSPTPDHYFCNLDHTGYRNDLRQRSAAFFLHYLSLFAAVFWAAHRF